MLEKGTELWEFEQEFFRFKKKWINQEITDEIITKLITEDKEVDAMLKKYDMNVEIASYVWCAFEGFINFLERKNKGYV